MGHPDCALLFGQVEDALVLGFVHEDAEAEAFFAGAEGAFAGVVGWVRGVDGSGGVEEVYGSVSDGGEFVEGGDGGGCDG